MVFVRKVATSVRARVVAGVVGVHVGLVVAYDTLPACPVAVATACRLGVGNVCGPPRFPAVYHRRGYGFPVPKREVPSVSGTASTVVVTGHVTTAYASKRRSAVNRCEEVVVWPR